MGKTTVNDTMALNKIYENEEKARQFHKAWNQVRTLYEPSKFGDYKQKDLEWLVEALEKSYNVASDYLLFNTVDFTRKEIENTFEEFHSLDSNDEKNKKALKLHTLLHKVYSFEDILAPDLNDDKMR